MIILSYNVAINTVDTFARHAHLPHIIELAQWVRFSVSVRGVVKDGIREVERKPEEEAVVYELETEVGEGVEGNTWNAPCTEEP